MSKPDKSFRSILLGAAAALGLGLSVFSMPVKAVAGEWDVAVIIGNKDYENRDIPDVEFAANDADAMERFFRDVLKIPTIIRIDDAEQSDFNRTFGNDRTHEGSEVWANIREGRSNLYLYYSGHGVPGLRDGESYLLPTDARNAAAAHLDGYSLSTLYKNLVATNAKSITVFMEACFTGGSDGGILASDFSGITVRATRPERAENMTILTAAGPDQLASWDRDTGHGLFTSHLLKGLSGEADRDDFGGNGDGALSYSEIVAYLSDEMTFQAKRRYLRTQDPSFEGDGETLLLEALPQNPLISVPTDDTETAAVAPDPQPAIVEPEPAIVTLSPEEIEAELGLSRDDWRRVQGSLLALEHDPEGVDGKPGENTRAAIGLWQSVNGFEITGFLDHAQYTRLIAEAAPKLAALEAALIEAEANKAIQPAVGLPADPYPVGKVFRDCTDCPEMVVVPPGNFMMGSPESEEGRNNDEGPQDEVKIGNKFAVGKFEVTRGQFAEFVSETGYDAGNRCWTFENGAWNERDGRNWRSVGFSQSDGHPVACVRWDDADAFVDWLSRKTGEEYRLLSEAEWEYVARAGTTTPYNTGSSISSRQANFNSNNNGTVTVGSYGANDFGLHDVHGNVWEWTEDCWNTSYRGAPKNGAAWESGDCELRMLRGGSWLNNPRGLRSASRGGDDSDYRNFNVGFRVARTISGS